MNKLTAYLTNEKTVTIDADRIEQTEDYIVAYNKDKMVGVFNLGFFTAIYLSEKKVDA